MENELRENLQALCGAFSEEKKLKESTIGRLCAADGRFFPRLRDGNTFTAKKYDEIVLWFSSNWPDGLSWPANIERPQPLSTQAAE